MPSTPPTLDRSRPPRGDDGRTDEQKAKAALRGGVFAYFVDMYDIYLPVLALLPAMAYFRSEDMSDSAAAIISSIIFVSTLLARPVGAAIFGHYADIKGRKVMTLIAVGGFGVTTLLIAALPGYEIIGVWSIILLIVLRFMDGIFLGGEYTTAVPLTMEWSPKNKRGIYGGMITSMSPASYAVIGLFTLFLLNAMPSVGVNSAYVQWGWRIPFVVGGLLAAMLFFWYLTQVEEPQLKKVGTSKERSPVLQLFSSEHRGALLQVFVMMTGIWLMTNMSSAVLPGLLVRHIGLTGFQVTLAITFMMVICVGAYLLFGSISQKFGRRRFFVYYGLGAALIASAAHILLMWLENSAGYTITVLLVVITGIFTVCAQAGVASYLTERFPPQVRASGYGVGFSLALIIPAFYAFYLEGISAVIPYQYAPVVLIVVGGLLTTVGAIWGPETRDVDMGRVGESRLAETA